MKKQKGYSVINCKSERKDLLNGPLNGLLSMGKYYSLSKTHITLASFLVILVQFNIRNENILSIFKTDIFKMTQVVNISKHKNGSKLWNKKIRVNILTNIFYVCLKKVIFYGKKHCSSHYSSTTITKKYNNSQPTNKCSNF